MVQSAPVRAALESGQRRMERQERGGTKFRLPPAGASQEGTAICRTSSWVMWVDLLGGRVGRKRQSSAGFPVRFCCKQFMLCISMPLIKKPPIVLQAETVVRVILKRLFWRNCVCVWFGFGATYSPVLMASGGWGWVLQAHMWFCFALWYSAAPNPRDRSGKPPDFSYS